MDRRDRPLLLTWVALLGLLALTAGSALLPLGWWNGVINLVVAAAKALLVLWVFMRLGRGHALLRLAAVTGLATLTFLFALAGSDYATRELAKSPWQVPRAVAARLGAR
jgi:cytochrome c oxidase subunit IV